MSVYRLKLEQEDSKEEGIGYIDMSKGLAIILVIIDIVAFVPNNAKLSSLFILHTVVFSIWFYF